MEPRFAESWNGLGYAYRSEAHEYIGRLYIALGNKEMAMRHHETLKRLDAKLAAELLRAIEANNPDLDE